MIEIKTIKSKYYECCNCYDRKDLVNIKIGEKNFYLCQNCLKILKDGIEAETSSQK